MRYPGTFLCGRRYTPIFATGAHVGTWLKIHDSLREWTRIEQERHPSPTFAIIDSQSVKSTAMVHEAVGYDAGKKITRSQAVYDRRYFGVSVEGIGNGG